MGMQGNGRMTLASAGGNRWKYSLDINSTLATLNQTTVFEDSDGAVAAAVGQRHVRGADQENNKNATYDWTKGVATLDRRREARARRPGQAAGRRSRRACWSTWRIVRDVAAGKPLSYRMVDDGRVKQLNYRSPARNRSRSAASRSRPPRSSAPTATSRHRLGRRRPAGPGADPAAARTPGRDGPAD